MAKVVAHALDVGDVIAIATPAMARIIGVERDTSSDGIGARVLHVEIIGTRVAFDVLHIGGSDMVERVSGSLSMNDAAHRQRPRRG